MSTAERVRRIVREELGLGQDALPDDACFVDDLGADSLAIVELVMALEDGFALEIPEHEAQKLRTIGDAIAYIECHAGTSVDAQAPAH